MALVTVPAKEAGNATAQGRETKGVTVQEEGEDKRLARMIKAPDADMGEEQVPRTVQVQAQGRATVPALEIARRQSSLETLQPFKSRGKPCCRRFSLLADSYLF